MTDAPEIIILQPCFTHGWEFPDRVKYETSIAIKYTRTDISQARIAELETTLRRLNQWFDTDQEIIDAMSSVEFIAHNRAHGWVLEALKAKP
jgi:hypothetical protein